MERRSERSESTFHDCLCFMLLVPVMNEIRDVIATTRIQYMKINHGSLLCKNGGCNSLAGGYLIHCWGGADICTKIALICA